MGQSSLGPISFDGACKVIRRSRPKRKKGKEVKDLGGLGIINPSYFAYVNSKKVSFSNKSVVLVEESNGGDDRFLGGLTLCCESLTDSDVIH